MENAHYGAKENDKKKSGSIHWNAAAFFCRVIRGRLRREAGEGWIPFAGITPPFYIYGARAIFVAKIVLLRK